VNYLLSFSVSNYASIADEVTINCTTTSSRPGLFPIPGGKYWVLPAVGIYGANASGKSSLLEAISFGAQSIMFSHRGLNPGDPFPRQVHRFGEWPSKPTGYKFDFLFDGVRHVYSFSITDTEVQHEELLVFASARPQVWFRRDGDKFGFPGKQLGALGSAIERITRPNSLMLSAAQLLGHPHLTEISDWLSQLHIWGPAGGRYQNNLGGESWITQGLKNESERAAFLKLARYADLGITNVDVETRAIERPSGQIDEVSHLVFTHQGSQAASFAWEEESDGTTVWLGYAALVSQIRRTSGVLIVDELDHSLHPALTQELLRMFQDPESNVECAQIIFSTHDTSLLNSSFDWALRKDQVWFAEKDKFGATHLTGLQEYRTNGRENAEKWYRDGRFGGVPIIDPTQLVPVN
jgi:AAA15 family ATPase/GTPase